MPPEVGTGAGGDTKPVPHSHGERGLCRPWQGLEGQWGLLLACTLNFDVDLLLGLGAAPLMSDFWWQLPGVGASLSWEWEGSSWAGRTGRGGRNRSRIVHLHGTG